MITQEIKLYEEPKPPPSYQSYNVMSFSKEEIDTAIATAKLCGFVEGMVLHHKPTGHTITILGFLDKKIRPFRNKPMVISGKRDRNGVSWETEYTVDELLDPDYVILDTPDQQKIPLTGD